MSKIVINKTDKAVWIDSEDNGLIDTTSSMNDEIDCIRGYRLSNVESMNLFCDEFKPINKKQFEKAVKPFLRKDGADGERNKHSK